MTPEEQTRLLPYTEHMGLPLNERIEVVNLVWKAMESVADQEWDINPVRHKRGQVEFNHLQNSDISLDSELIRLQEEFKLH